MATTRTCRAILCPSRLPDAKTQEFAISWLRDCEAVVIGRAFLIHGTIITIRSTRNESG